MLLHFLEDPGDDKESKKPDAENQHCGTCCILYEYNDDDRGARARKNAAQSWNPRLLAGAGHGCPTPPVGWVGVVVGECD